MIVSYKILKEQGFNLDKLFMNYLNGNINNPFSTPIGFNTLKNRFQSDRVNNIKLVLKYYPKLIEVNSNELNETKYNYDKFINLLEKFQPVRC